jgi:hypothetical protein
MDNKMRKRSLLVVATILCGIGLGSLGCVPNRKQSSTLQPKAKLENSIHQAPIVGTAVNSPMSTNTALPIRLTQERTRLATPTTSPTLSLLQYGNLIHFMDSNNSCELPCVLGIVPGKTSADAAWRIFQENLQDGTYYDNMPKSLSAEIWYSKGNNSIDYSLLASAQQEEIKTIEVRISVSNNGITQAVDNFVPYYSLEAIFEKLGEPDYIFLGISGGGEVPNSYYIEIYYLAKRIVFSITGISNNYDVSNFFLCPDVGGYNYVSLQMFVFSNDVEIKEKLNDQLNYHIDYGYHLLMQEATGMTNKEFVNAILNNDNYCFYYSPIK